MPPVPDDATAEVGAPSPEVLGALLDQAPRTSRGRLDDTVTWAAVVGVERVALVAGTTDPARLRLLLQGAADGAVRDEVHAAWQRVADAIDLATRDRGPDSGVVHRDAGHHSVTTDAERLRAALRAAHRTFEGEPYYRDRYADRGARFAGSDSAWLVTLADLPADAAVGQAQWLARVLAGRGMPSWLLERHLDDLSEELRDAGIDPGALPTAAGALRDQRRTALGDDRLASADARLAEAVPVDAAPVGAAGLALAAAADVATGLAASADPCLVWLTDPVRCAPSAAEALRALAGEVAPAAAAAGPASGRARAGRVSAGRVSAGRSRAGSRAPRS